MMGGEKGGVLVVGAGGFIGSRLIPRFREEGRSVRGLSSSAARGAAEGDVRILPFDILAADDDWGEALNFEAEYGVICSAETKIDACRTDPERSRLLNVLGPIRLIEEFRMRGTIPVFFSSNAVFDGEKGGYAEEDAPRPLTEYGRQKREVEEFLENSGGAWLVLRLTKVFDVERGDGTLITRWIDAMRRGEPVRCATDQFLNPTYAGDVARAVLRAMGTGLRGLYHVASPESFSRHRLALLAARRLGLDESLVRESSIGDFDFLEPRSRYDTLDSTRFRAELGFDFTPMEDCLSMIEAHYAA